MSSDDIVRRSAPVKEIAGQVYPSISHALWQILQQGHINTTQIKKDFPDGVEADNEQSIAQRNVNGNMIWIKTYQEGRRKDCPTFFSHWQKLRKYSVTCDLTSITTAHFDNSVLLLGGTFQKNEKYHHSENDYHEVLDFGTTDNMSGVDIHANTLMTLLHLNRPMQQVPLVLSFTIVFICFFCIDLFVGYLFKSRYEKHKTWTLIFLLIISTIILFPISLLFLHSKYHLWFNWATPIILNESIDFFIIAIKHASKVFSKSKKKVVRTINLLKTKIKECKNY